jgi:hypothetical protein
MCDLPKTKVISKGAEWDGAFWCLNESKWHLFLVEAKTTITLSHITQKPEAVNVTKEFIVKSHTGEIQRNTTNTHVKQLAACWSEYYDYAEIHVVFGAQAFDSEMIAELENLQYMRICLNEELYYVYEPSGDPCEIPWHEVDPYESDS